MCKYCELVTDEDTGERLNNNKSIVKMRDGSRVIDLSINRYIVDDMNIHKSELIIDLGVSLEAGDYTVKVQTIPIKYCPFCGEEL